MLLLAYTIFIVLLVYGFRENLLRWGTIGKGLTPALLVLLINGLIGYFAWDTVIAVYPGYTEILQGFSYNGQVYIIAFVFLSLAVCFWTYGSFRKIPLPDLIVMPLLFHAGGEA
jgi:hypothetical protein